MKKIILLGGAPGTGKTTLAKLLMESKQIPGISTDQIRDDAKKIVDKVEYADLFLDTNSIKDPEEILQIVIRQSRLIWRFVSTFISEPGAWKAGVVEGMVILPSLVNEFVKQNPHIRVHPIFVLQDNIEIIKHIIEERSKLPWIKTKTPEQQEDKLRQVIVFNEYLKTEAEKYGYQTLNMGDSIEEAFENLLKIIED